MADTTELTVTSTAWVEAVGAATQAILTPVLPGRSFLIRYASTQPNASVTIGHKFFAKDDIPNAIVGSANTEKCWLRAVQVEILEIVVSEI